MNDPGYRNVDFDELREAYNEQVRGLIDGGVDIILVETIFDTLNAKAAVFATLEVFEEKGIELPIMISGTITDRSGRTLSGQTAEAFWNSVRHLQAVLGRAQLRARRRADAAVHRRACRTSPTRASRPTPTPACPTPSASTTRRPTRWRASLRAGPSDGIVNIVGGCCGTTPEHIRAHRRRASPESRRRGRSPRSRRALRLSGLEAVRDGGVIESTR